MIEEDEEAQVVSAETASTMLCPSSMAAKMRPELEPAEAAAKYVTHGHDLVEPDMIREALVYLEYANASYYIEASSTALLNCACQDPQRAPRKTVFGPHVCSHAAKSRSSTSFQPCLH